MRYVMAGAIGFTVSALTGWHAFDSWQWWAIAAPFIILNGWAWSHDG